MSKLFLGLFIFWLGVSPFVYAGEGHDAGYEWAEENGISDESNCYDVNGGSINNSPSFTEGCLEYVNGASLAAPADDLDNQIFDLDDENSDLDENLFDLGE